MTELRTHLGNGGCAESSGIKKKDDTMGIDAFWHALCCTCQFYWSGPGTASAHRGSAMFIILLLFLPVPAQAVVVEDKNAWNGIFAGKLVPYDITLSGEPDTSLFLSWKLTTKGRTLSAGNQTIALGSRDSMRVSLPLRTPAVKPGAMVSAQLVVDLSAENRPEAAAHHEFPIFLYGPGALSSDGYVHQQLRIRLFDPVGRTKEIFDELAIPHLTVRNDELLREPPDGLLVLGTGIALDHPPELLDSLVKLALAGGKVLVFQPRSGTVALPGRSFGSGIQASAMTLAGDSIIRTVTGGYPWLTDDPMKHYGIGLRRYGETTVAGIGSFGHDQWDWLHISFDQTGGQFIICTIPVIEHALDNPIPQIILGRLLAYAGKQEPDSKSQHREK